MLRRILGVVAAAGVFTLAPITIDPQEPGQVPVPVLSELQCEEAGTCCFEAGSVCAVDGKPYIHQRSAGGMSCNE